METPIVYWAYIGILEKKVETTIPAKNTSGTTGKRGVTTKTLKV